MDSQHLHINARSAFLRNPLARRILGTFLGSLCLWGSSGCAFTKSVLLKPIIGDVAEQSQQAGAAGKDCAKPDCAAPGPALTSQVPLTAMPVPQMPVPQMAVPPAVGELPLPAPALTSQFMAQPVPNVPPLTSSAQAGNVAQSTVPQIPVVTMVPPGWKLVPESTAAAPGRMDPVYCVPVPVPGSSYPDPAAHAPVVDVKLQQCEQQMAEMTAKVTGLQNSTEVTRQAMLNMAVEQMRLRNENEALKQRAEENHREFIQSIDSISQFIDEVTPPETAEPPAPQPVPQQSTRRTKKRPAEMAVLLPSVE